MAKPRAISKQQRWQQKMVVEGRCRICGHKREHYKVMCDGCATIHRQRLRTRGGYKPWRTGGPGRPPKAK